MKANLTVPLSSRKRGESMFVYLAGLQAMCYELFTGGPAKLKPWTLGQRLTWSTDFLLCMFRKLKDFC